MVTGYNRICQFDSAPKIPGMDSSLAGWPVCLLFFLFVAIGAGASLGVWCQFRSCGLVGGFPRDGSFVSASLLSGTYFPVNGGECQRLLLAVELTQRAVGSRSVFSHLSDQCREVLR